MHIHTYVYVHILIIDSFTDGYLNFVHLLAILNNVAVKIGISISSSSFPLFGVYA